jgi:hypothetical protein
LKAFESQMTKLNFDQIPKLKSLSQNDIILIKKKKARRHICFKKTNWINFGLNRFGREKIESNQTETGRFKLFFSSIRFKNLKNNNFG